MLSHYPPSAYLGTSNVQLKRLYFGGISVRYLVVMGLDGSSIPYQVVFDIF